MSRRTALASRILLALGVSTIGDISLLAGDNAQTAGADEVTNFSLIVLPDTQGYLGTDGTFTLQTSWIQEMKDSLNIRFVLHEGDLVSSPLAEGAWRDASYSLGILDDSVPYILNVDNHDMGDTNGNSASRDKRNYNRFFPASRFECQPWYGDRLATSENSNYYTLFDVGELRFLIISLEFGPDDQMLEWANKVVSQNLDRRVIVLTHCYTNYDDTRVGPGDFQNPHDYAIDRLGTNDGEEIWDKLVRHHANIFLVLSGHVHAYGSGYEAGRVTSVGDNGNSVHQLMANYQNVYYHLGDGWLRILNLNVPENRISVSTYSPLLDQWMDNDENSFDLYYDMSAPLRGDGSMLRADDPQSSRYLSIAPDPDTVMALRVNLRKSFLPVSHATGWWVGPADSNGRAQLQDEPLCQRWASEGIDVFGAEILPGSEYDIRAVLCDHPLDPSTTVTVRTCGRGDVNCDGTTNVNDVGRTVDAVKATNTETRCDQLPDGKMNVLDVATTIDAVKETPWTSFGSYRICDQ